ncbi:MAG: hypothetical protein IPH93_05660 [Saprospiraceae bacterium]|nr:hypothetical protein [Saprospiraceae bacterium]MBK9631721.1 hypothetical protein [Saprospiraceae bacterium]
MKITKFVLKTNRVALIFFSTILILFITSCGRKLSFKPSTIVPGAEGTVSIKTDENKNYRIKLKIFNLAEPNKLEYPGKLYIVWMQNDQNSISNLGQIKTSSSSFSKSLKASFQTVSSFKPVKIFITAEQESNILTPSRIIILTTDRL